MTQALHHKLHLSISHDPKKLHPEIAPFSLASQSWPILISPLSYRGLWSGSLIDLYPTLAISHNFVLFGRMCFNQGVVTASGES